VNGTLTASSNGLTISATSSNASDAAVGGTGIFGVVGLSESTSGIGVSGYDLATTGTTYGVAGESSSTGGYGVYGSSPHIGVEGFSSATAGVGVQGSSSTYVGVYGAASGTSIEGSEGRLAGVWGDTGGASGTYSGVLGTADNNSAGSFFNNSGASPTINVENDDTAFGDEVFSAYLNDIESTAIIGDPGCNYGFIALQLGQGRMSGCNNYTLTGGENGHTYINAVSGAAVHLRVNSVEQLEVTSGNINIYGNLTVSGNKNFRIDHPLDPANRYLYHAAIESSEVLNLYSGNVALDASGEAVVQLPEWFEVINKDFRYQLTPIGAPGRDLYIAEEVSGGHFKIAGGKPGGRVSWQVSGVRNDAWEKAHPMVVEADKGAARGQYLTPELYGAPETARIGYMAPAPGSEQTVRHRPAFQNRGNASPLQRTPPSIPAPPPMPVAPKVAPIPHAPAAKLAVNQK
jgi:hypothetical protein